VRRRRVLVALCLALAAAFGVGSWIPHQRLAQRLTTPSRVYGRPLVLAPGVRVDRGAVAAHLGRARYRAGAAPEVATGEHHLTERRLSIGRRPFRYPDGDDPGGPVTVDLDPTGVVKAISGPGGVPLETVFLEPEVLGTLTGEDAEDRVLVPLAELPRHLVEAVLVTEDSRFRWHPGIDPIRAAAAAGENLRRGRVVEGGSTITQQLVKNLYLSPDRTWQRKAREAVLALWLELRHAKDEILEAYLNQIYLGQDGGRAIHGVGRAAHFFFGKEASELAVAESALLAGMIQAPNALSPFRHPERARARRDAVLDLMQQAGHIDRATHESARAAPLGVRREEGKPRFAAHFVDRVRERLEERFAESALERDGLRVFSTLDGGMQRAAERAAREGLEPLEREYPRLRRDRSPVQAAIVVLDPASGDVLAWVGARDASRSSYDRAARARRQPGSLFKPVVALAALRSDAKPRFTLATLLEDRPLELEVEGEIWSPTNYDGRHRGPVTLREALEDSLNVPFARLALEVGLVEVADTARRIGIESPLRPVPSLALGAFEVTPVEIATVYAVLASGGVRSRPRTTLTVLRPDGKTLRGDPLERRRAFDDTDSYLVTAALEGAVERGSARRLRQLGVSAPVAGKTGTTNEFRDAWFVGYAPDLVVAVWVGFDDGARVGLSGARAAMPIFARFLREAGLAHGLRGFSAPEDVESVEIDPATGLATGPGCPQGRAEVFRAGTAPRRSACGPWRDAIEWVRRAVER
jgi:penicillin-binding protein 1B